MNLDTIQRLNQINADFYATTAEQFDLLRRGSWPGWKRLATHFPVSTDHALTVLDVGCGNGRFGVFLARTLTTPIHLPIRYHGQDFSPQLLAHAQTMTQGIAGLDATFEQRDIVQETVSADNPQTDEPQYDLIVLFGVLHHIPGMAQRRDLMRTLAMRVISGGIMAFACWRFYEYERYREKLVTWPDGLDRETHDYLLDWRRGTPALRYCHYVDDNEHAQLVTVTGLTEIDTFRADGDAGNVNRYSVLRKDKIETP